MNFILDFFSIISAQGATVMMPIIITILGLALGAQFGRALRAGLTVGVGFLGLNLVVGVLGSNLGPAAQQMVEKYGLSMSIPDIGWPAAAAIAFGSTVGTFIIPLGLVINIVMLLTNTTQTLNVDIWNYWHFAFTGAMVQSLTGSLAYGLIAAALNMIIVMVIADLTAPGLEEYNGLPGISLPHGFTGAFAPIAMLINWVIDMIPGLNKVEIDMDVIQNKMGVFGEPLLIGTVIGMIIAAVAGYPIILMPGTAAANSVLSLGVTMGAVLVLIPKMAAMLMEGLIPVSDAAQVMIEKRFKDRGKVYIGLDSAVGIGHPVALTCGLLLTPLTLLLAAILPGNRMLPFADLAVIPFIIVLIIPVTKGNFFRSFICGLFVMVAMLYVGTDMAELFTATAKAANFAIDAATPVVSSICDGSNPLTWAMVRIMNFGIVGIIILAVVAIGMAVWNRTLIIKQAKHETAA